MRMSGLRKSLKKAAVSMLAAVLVFTSAYGIWLAETYAASGAEAHGADSTFAEWEDLIPAMLSSGSYEEGTVIAGVKTSANEALFKGKAHLQAEKLVDSAEEIMTVEAESLESVLADGNAARAPEGAETEGAPEGAGSEGMSENAGTEGAPESDGAEIKSGLRLNLADDDEDVRFVYIARKDMTTEELLRTLAEDPEVVFAEPNYIKEAADRSESEDDEDAGGEESDWIVDPAKEPADLTQLQWSSFEDAAFHAPNVSGDVSMKIPGFGPTGSDMEGGPVTVAVLDGAVDFNNPDLKDAAYTFSPEQQAALGCDVHGYNALHVSKDGKLTYWAGGDHGTHCAGIIGASWDGRGISGAASNVRLISIQILNEDGRTSLIDALRGFAFVKRANEEAGAGIRITSNSWGDIQSSLAINAAAAELGRTQDVLSVFAAGNDASDLQEIEYQPKTYYDNPYIIVVASMEYTGGISYFSNYGSKTVTLGAPGSCIMSTIGMDNGSYISDADPAPRFFEGFEAAGEPGVRITQLTKEGEEVPGAYTEVVTGKSVPGYAGRNVLKLHLDKSKAAETSGSYKRFLISMKFGDLAKLGVQKGDYFGFAATASDIMYVMGDGVVIKGETPVKTTLKDIYYAVSDSFEWILPCLRLPEADTFSDLELNVEIWLRGDADEIFFDSFGFGSQLAAYGIKSGTSMATPAVSGAAAILASRFRDASADELAKITASSVRESDALKGITVTGGVIDLTKSPSTWPLGEQDGGSGTSSQTGGEQGGNSDEQGGNSDEQGGAANRVLFEEDLPMDNSTGDPFVFDGRGDMETFGPLEAIGGKLYYLPAFTKIERQPAHKAMFCYDTAAQTWSRMADLPEWLSKTSSAVLGGMLYVKGETMLTPDDPEVPYIDDNSSVVCFSYDPETDEWSKTSTAGLTHPETLMSDGKKLLLAGGAFMQDDKETERGTIREYDPEKGAGKVLTVLNKARKYPQAEYSDGRIYLYDSNYYELEVVDTAKYSKGKVLKDALPEYKNALLSGGVYTEDAIELTLREGRLAAAPGGILLLGPNAEDGSADTYFMSTGGTKFAPLGKNMAGCKVNSIAATSDGDKVYALGFAWEESEKRIFRAAALEKPANPMTVTAKNKTYKAAALKKKARTYKALTVKKAKGAVKYKVTYKNKKSKKALTFYKKTGKIKVKKGTKKGTYKVTIKITASGTVDYKPAAMKKTIKVKVK